MPDNNPTPPAEHIGHMEWADEGTTPPADDALVEATGQMLTDMLEHFSGQTLSKSQADAIARTIIPIVRSHDAIDEDALTICYMKGVKDGRDAERDDVVSFVCRESGKTGHDDFDVLEHRIAANAHREKR